MRILFTSIILFVASCINAQNSEKKIVKKSEIKVISTQTASFQIDSVMLAKKNQPTIESVKTVEYYDNYIQAIETKIAYIKADSNLSLEAEKNGWFIQMDEYLRKAKYERNALINSK